jgi:hypothetical protein
MNQLRRLLGLAALWFLPMGCGTDRVAGSSSETENMLARAIPVDSLVSPWNHPVNGVTVATIRLDSSNFDFRRSTSTGLDVTVERTDGRLLPFEIVLWDSVAARARLHVRLDSSLLVGKQTIILRWGQPKVTRANPVAVWNAIPESQHQDVNSVLIDDFERGTLNSLLPNFNPWYVIEADSVPVLTVPTLVPASLGRLGTAAYFSYVKPYSLMGLDLGGHRSLRSFDSLVLWARGTGVLLPAFDNLDSGSGGKAWTQITLDSTAWTRIRIRPQDLDTADNLAGNVGWISVRDRVSYLTFLVAAGHDVYLDDIRLYGIDRDDLK